MPYADEKITTRRLLSILSRFSQFDPKMKLSTVQALLVVALAESNNEELPVREVERKLGLTSSDAGRKVHFWGDGNPATGEPGLGLIRVGDSRLDGRARSLSLTARGRAFINEILE